MAYHDPAYTKTENYGKIMFTEPMFSIIEDWVLT